MRGLGTIINMACILLGGFVGLLFGKKFKDRLRETVTIATGVAVMFMGAGGAFARMLSITGDGLTASGSVMMICSLVIGAVIGELADIDHQVYVFGEWLKKKSGSSGDNSFVNGFVNTSCTVCIGAMAVMGSIQDGISGDYSILMAKGLLDAIIVCMMASSQGKGCVFSAIPVGLWQGFITLIAVFAGNFLPDASIAALSYVGNILIFLVGVNLTFNQKIRVANLLPSIFIAAIWGALA